MSAEIDRMREAWFQEHRASMPDDVATALLTAWSETKYFERMWREEVAEARRLELRLRDSEARRLQPPGAGKT